MPIYVINGRKVKSDKPLSEDEIDDIAANFGGSVQKEAERGPNAIPGYRDEQGRTAYDIQRQRQAELPVTLGEQMFGLGSPLASFVKGAVVNPLVGVNQLLANTGLFGGKVKEGANALAATLEQNTSNARKRVGREGFDFTELGGSVLSPVNKLLGPVKGAGLKETIGRSMASSAAQAAIAPTKEGDRFFEKKADDIVVAAVLGGALPLVAATIKGGKSLATKLTAPLSEKGKENLIRTWFNEQLPADKQKVIDALKGAQEIVPGSKPTVGEALADMPESTSIASAQKFLSGTGADRISQKFATRAAEQQGARQAAVGTVAQTPEALKAAIDARASEAVEKYNKAFANSVNVNPRLAVMFRDNPFLSSASEIATKKAAAFESNNPGKKASLTQVLHWTKQSLDDRISSADTDPSLKASLSATKKSLVDWMKVKNPDYDAARKAFAEASKPVNEMQIGQYLQLQLNTALDVERAGVFAKAVQEAPKTIKKATGESVYETLEQALTPKQSAAIRSVEADLQRMVKFQQNASRTRSGSPSPDDAPEMPQLLNRWATITNAFLKVLKRGTNEELNTKVADLLLNPQELAGFLSTMPKEPGKAKVVANTIMERLTPENRAAFAAALQHQEE